MAKQYELTIALKENPSNTWVDVVEREYVGAYLCGITNQGLAIVTKVEAVKE